MRLRLIAATLAIALAATALPAVAEAAETEVSTATVTTPAAAAQQPSGNELVALIQFIVAVALLDVANSIMLAAIDAGPSFEWLWNAGKGLWDAACVMGKAAEQVLPLPKPYFVFACTLYPRWPY